MPGSLFLAGLVGSVTHCAGMCSPFVLAQTQSGQHLSKWSGPLLLPYHIGRMTTYIMLGVIAHSVLNLAYIFSEAKALLTAPLLFLAGLVFCVSAFPVLGKIFPWAEKIKLPGVFTRIAAKGSQLAMKNGTGSGYLLGVALGFIPCGLVIAALMAASTAPTLPQAAFALAAFSVGTMPSLMAVGLCGRSLNQKFPSFSNYLSRTALLASSAWLFFLAGSLIL